MKIFFVNGIRAGEELDYAISEIKVGRESDNHLRLPADGVSRYHGRFVKLGPGIWQVEDTESTNGVKVNREKIKNFRVLAEGDIVEFGDQVLKVANLSEETPRVVFETLSSGTETPVYQAATQPPPPGPPSGDMTATLDIMEALKKGGGKIFERKPKDENLRDESPGRKKHFSNLFFYIILIAAAAICFSVFRLINSGGNAKISGGGGNTDNLALVYEKITTTDDNVFRFAMTLENNNATFTVDDLKAQRHYRKTVGPVAEDVMNTLKNALDRSQIMFSKSPAPGPSVNNRLDKRRIVMAIGGKMNDVEVVNDYPAKSFEDAEYAITSFAGQYDMQVNSMTKEELMAKADENFRKGEDFFENRDSHPGYLRRAIGHYQLVLDYLNEFSPKPDLWAKARRQFGEAEKIRKQRLRDWELDYERAYNYRELGKMQLLLRQKLELVDLNSNEYNETRVMLSKLENLMRTNKK